MTFEEWVKKNKTKDEQASVNWGGASNRATPAKSASEAKSFDEWVTTNYGTQQQKYEESNACYGRGRRTHRQYGGSDFHRCLGRAQNATFYRFSPPNQR